MLNRFGLVIHWIGFIGSVTAFPFLVIAIAIEIGAVGSFLNQEEGNALMALSFGPLPIGWVIRFILTGHKGLMPWSKAKQPESPEN